MLNIFRKLRQNLTSDERSEIINQRICDILDVIRKDI